MSKVFSSREELQKAGMDAILWGQKWKYKTWNKKSSPL
jgi:hypothetical protein